MPGHMAKRNSEGSGQWPLVRTCWPFGVLAALLNAWRGIDVSVYVPYIYSRVQCCGPHGDLHSKYDIKKPSRVRAVLKEAASLGLSVPLVNKRIRACAVPEFPPHSKMWSQSPGCVNAAFVYDTSQRILGINLPLQKVLLILVLPVGGTIADACGRQPVLLAYGAMCLLASITFMLDTRLCHVWGDVMIMFAATFLCPCWEPKDAVMVGSVLDLVGDRAAERNSALSLLWACSQVGSVVTALILFFILRLHLSSYFPLWLAYSCLALFIVAFTKLVVPETLPEELRSGIRLHMFNPLQSQFHALSLMFHDKTLIMLMVVGFLMYVHVSGTMTMAFSYLMQHGFSQEEAALPTLLSGGIQILSASLRARYEAGVMNCFIAANVAWFLGYSALGLLVPCIGRAAGYIAFACFGVGWSLYFPSAQAIVSAHMGEEDQAKCQSAVVCIGNVGAIIGPIIWSSCIYDATATGFAEMTPMIASMAVAVVCTALAVAIKIWESSPKPKTGPFETDSAPLLGGASKSASTSYGNA